MATTTAVQGFALFDTAIGRCGIASPLGKRLRRGFMSPTLNLPESDHGAELNAHNRIGLVSGEGRSRRRGRAPGER